MSTIAAKLVPARRPARARHPKNPAGVITWSGTPRTGLHQPQAQRAGRLTRAPRAAARRPSSWGPGLRLRDPGSVTADSSYRGDDHAPELIQDNRDGSPAATGQDRHERRRLRPRPGQWRVTFPEDARNGAVAHRHAQAASDLLVTDPDGTAG